MALKVSNHQHYWKHCAFQSLRGPEHVKRQLHRCLSIPSVGLSRRTSCSEFLTARLHPNNNLVTYLHIDYQSQFKIKWGFGRATTRMTSQLSTARNMPDLCPASWICMPNARNDASISQSMLIGMCSVHNNAFPNQTQLHMAHILRRSVLMSENSTFK